jgi:hypothetical protein
MGRVLNFRSGYVHAVHYCRYPVKVPNFKLRTRPKQLLVYLQIDIELPSLAQYTFLRSMPNFDIMY